MTALLWLCAIVQGVALRNSDQCNPNSSPEVEIEDHSALFQGLVKVSMQQGSATRVDSQHGAFATHEKHEKLSPARHVPGTSHRIGVLPDLTRQAQIDGIGILPELHLFMQNITVASRPVRIQIAVVSAIVGILLVSMVLLFGLAHFTNMILFVLYIGWSSAILFVNRSLVHREAFVHPIVLVTIHMFTCMVLTRALSFAKPHWFTGLEQMQKQTREKQMELWRAVYLIAFFYAVSLVSENSAYFYSSVALLQMIKESGIFFVAVFAVLFGVDQLSARRHSLLILVVFGAVLCVDGDVTFTFLGPIIQMTANVANGMRLTLQNRLMVLDGNVKLDPLSYTTLVSPFCFLALLVPAATVTYVHPDVFAVVWQARGTVLISCALAVGINLLVAALVQRVAAVGFCLLGAVKNASVITYSFLILGQETTTSQVVGCTLIFGAAALYTIVKEWERKPDSATKTIEEVPSTESNPQSG